MKPFLILALAALAQARPEAGYAYNAPAPAPAPSSSYGIPSSGGNLGLSGLSGGGFAGGHSGGYSGGHSGAGLGGGSFGSSGLGFSGISSGFGGAGGSFGGAQQSFSSAGSSASSFGGSSSFGGAQSFSSGSSFGGYQNQAPLISKHVYVHVAPEEPEVIRPARINTASQARKHYKIVFIKAPTAPTPTAAQVQLPQQDEEKTIIYVLSKKQEDQPDIQVQSAAPTTPTKPEVYFIKYNTKKEQGGSGLSLSAGAAPSTGYGVPSAISANAAAPSSSYGAPSSLSAAAAAAPSNSYGVPSAHGGPY